MNLPIACSPPLRPSSAASRTESRSAATTASFTQGATAPHSRGVCMVLDGEVRCWDRRRGGWHLDARRGRARCASRSTARATAATAARVRRRSWPAPRPMGPVRRPLRRPHLLGPARRHDSLLREGTDRRAVRVDSSDDACGGAAAPPSTRPRARRLAGPLLGVEGKVQCFDPPRARTHEATSSR